MENTSTNSSPQPNSFPIDLFCALLLFGFFYRVKLHLLLVQDPKLLSATFSSSLFSFFVASLFFEIFFAGLLTILTFIGVKVFELFQESLLKESFKAAFFFLYFVFLIVCSFVYETHFRLLEIMQVGLTYESISEAIQAFSWGAWLRYIQWKDCVVVVTPFVFFLCCLWMPPLWKKIRNLALFPIVLLCVLFIFFQNFKSSTLNESAYQNPLLFTLKDCYLYWKKRAKKNVPPVFLERKKSLFSSKRSKNSTQKTILLDSLPSQKQSIQSISPLFMKQYKIHKQLPVVSKKKWNIVWVVMESIGSSYIFDQKTGEIPMPFLNQYKKQCWHLSNHFSPSNSSARSLFSQMSGLYPNPNLHMFAVNPQNHIPSLVNFLEPEYDLFLVQPSLMNWFFPKSFLENSGLTDMKGFYELPLRNPNRPRASRNEEDTVTYFLERVKNAKRPFFSSYVSFIAHWPYHDYGAKYHIRKVFQRKKNLYYSNLRMLDEQLKRMIQLLKEENIAKDTIVVLAGDHGEAFGQHHGNWTHARKSFNENFQTPAFLCQPRLFAPKKIKEWTTHADILPTLLDALGKKYNPYLFQGESLFQTELRQKYIFLYGNENTITSIDRKSLYKMQLSKRNFQCWLYDLKKDPQETIRYQCDKKSAQWKALWNHSAWQSKVLKSYSKQTQQRKSFHGAVHPQIFFR